MLFNPLMMINKEEVRRRVEKLRSRHPDLTNRELCELIIIQKSRFCAASGAITALPAALPVIGTLVTVIGGTALDVTAISFFTAEMVLEMSAVYGRDLYLPGVSREALWVMATAVSSDMAGKTAGKLAMKQMQSQFFTRLANDLLLTLGVQVTRRTILKVVPLLGAAIAGTINYFICRHVGRLAADYYEENSYEKWVGETIDIEGEIVE